MDVESAFQVLSDPNASDRGLRTAFSVICRSEKVEAPDAWIRIINDVKYTDAHRARCFFQFFSRHVPEGADLLGLLKAEGVSTWFAGENVFDRTFASKLPSGVDRTAGGSVFMIQPSFLSEQGGAVYLRLSERCTVDELVELARTKSGQSSIAIAQIAFSGERPGGPPH